MECFNDLPNEVLIGVGEYLDGIDVARCQSVKRSWSKAFSDSRLWRQKLAREFGVHVGPNPKQEYGSLVQGSTQWRLVQGKMDNAGVSGVVGSEGVGSFVAAPVFGGVAVLAEDCDGNAGVLDTEKGSYNRFPLYADISRRFMSRCSQHATAITRDSEIMLERWNDGSVDAVPENLVLCRMNESRNTDSVALTNDDSSVLIGHQVYSALLTRKSYSVTNTSYS
jgi:hypothetical protein